MEYTRLTNLEVTGHLKVSGQEVTPGGGSSTLSGLTDVDISNPTDGQVLVYDAASQKWVNGAGGGGGSGTLVVHAVPDDLDTRLDHTFAEISAAGYAVLLAETDIGGGQYVIQVAPLASLGYSNPGTGDPLYFVIFVVGEDRATYTTATQNGYPTLVK